MTCSSGPPCWPGKTALSTALACSALQRIMPPRGPRSVLCVVVVTKSEHGAVDLHVRLRARVRLHVGVVGAEDLLGALDRQRLAAVDVLAAAVVALPGVALGVLVRERRPHGREDRVRDDVLGRDEDDVL